MTFWIVLAGILLVLWLLGRIRVGAAAAYSEAGFFLSVKIGPARIQILPSQTQKKEKTPKKPKESTDQPAVSDNATKPKRNVKDTVSVVLRFLPLVGEAAGRFKRKISIDYIKLHIIWGASDPAAAAKGYGAGNAAMGILWPVVEHNFKVKEHDLRVDVDFEQTKPEFVGEARITITIGQCFSLALILGMKALKIYLGIRREKTEITKNEKAVQA